MKPIKVIETDDLKKFYDYINLKIVGFLNEENDCLANFSNISAILKLMLKDINWVGFYFLKNDELVLGPFQGLPACTRLEIGKGVCGTAVAEEKTQLVANVHEFEGHVACDEASKSEIVIPIFVENRIVGVLDIDSPKYNRFTIEDRAGLEKIAKSIESYIRYEGI